VGGSVWSCGSKAKKGTFNAYKALETEEITKDDCNFHMHTMGKLKLLASGELLSYFPPL